MLPSGAVLIAGGTRTTSAATATTEIYDLPTGTFGLAANLSVARTQHVAAFLFNGSALVAGGTTVLGPADLLTP